MINEEDLWKEMDYGCGLIRKRFGIVFQIPKIYCGSEFIRIDFLKRIKSGNIFAGLLHRNCPRYDPENGIGIPSEVMEQNHPERMYILLHELGHAAVDQTNPLLYIQRDILNDEYTSEYAVRCAFSEGIADYIAIESCMGEDKEMSRQGVKRRLELSDSLAKWIKDFAERSSVPAEEWRKHASAYLQKNPRRMELNQYIMGYHFMSSLPNPDLENLIKNPPLTIEELIFPEKYNFRLFH